MPGRLVPLFLPPSRRVLCAGLIGACAVLAASLGVVVASEYSMATGDGLQWSPDGAGHFRPMDLDPHDPTGNPWLFGEQFQEPVTSALPWAQQPASSQGAVEYFEPRPWGEQGRRDRYRGDAERERLRRLHSAPSERRRDGSGRYPRADGRFDLVPRPAAHRRPLSPAPDYSVGRGSESRDSRPWRGDPRPW